MCHHRTPKVIMPCWLLLLLWDGVVDAFPGKVPWCILQPRKPVLREEVFMWVPVHGSLWPESKVSSILSNRHLPFFFMDQARAITTVCIVLGVYGTTVTNNSKESFTCWKLGIYIWWSFALGGLIVRPGEKTSLNLYMYICTQPYVYYRVGLLHVLFFWFFN